MRNHFENVVEAPEKRDEMLEGFLTDAEFIFKGLPVAVGVSRYDAVKKFEELFEESKTDKDSFVQNLIDANKGLHEWMLQQEMPGIETKAMKVKHGGIESVYDEERLCNTRVDAIYTLIEKIIIEHARKK